MVASGVDSTAIGKQSNTQSIAGRMSYGAGFITTIGDNQISDFLFKRRTTDATATVLTTNNAAAATTNQLILSNNSVVGFTGMITARRQAAGGAVAKVWKVEGAIRREANAATTTLVGTPTVTVIGNDA